jgi:malonate-semialdehyde dehydrogenase (acetylating)/methylmalonate-semialdehyde dehydrogenase
MVSPTSNPAPQTYSISANKNLALNSIIGAAFGAAGQRCMALSVGMKLYSCFYVKSDHILPAILVGEAQNWLPDLVERAKKLKVTNGFEPGVDM